MIDIRLLGSKSGDRYHFTYRPKLVGADFDVRIDFRSGANSGSDTSGSENPRNDKRNEKP